MDTRQLAAFCEVVERRSFSQAAERLGVTQPAVSLQVRALEKRLGQRLLDRSGRRVEPTEAGLRLYRGASRLLTLERQLLEDVAGDGEGAVTGELKLGASTGPAAIVVPLLLCEFQRRNSGVHVSLVVGDTQRIVDEVAICLPVSDWEYIEPVTVLCREEGKAVRIPLADIGLAGNVYGVQRVLQARRREDRDLLLRRRSGNHGEGRREGAG